MANLSVGGDAEVAPGRNQAQLIPGALCPEQRSDTIATRWLVGGLTTSPPLPRHVVPRASRPDRLLRRARCSIAGHTDLLQAANAHVVGSMRMDPVAQAITGGDHVCGTDFNSNSVSPLLDRGAPINLSCVGRR